MSDEFAAELTRYMQDNGVQPEIVAHRCGYTLVEMTRILAGLYPLDAPAKVALVSAAGGTLSVRFDDDGRASVGVSADD